MTKIIPTLRVFDYAKTLEFYVEWLGCTIKGEYKAEGSPFWMQVSFREAVTRVIGASWGWLSGRTDKHCSL